ncbi:hypothetical protein CFAM422_000200 [Trichoderma lentiforme]|uniref:Spo12-like protein n=1 Tax=Trichoderma lentiforme TaxID=1567552 RepID=A0A9P4XQW3_9HYPO|nr:hypothetical protein CFAM422_000200 [Trichoderma lentiforme]
MSSNKILGDRDVNAALADGQPLGKDVKSMEYHRQVFQSRMAQDGVKQYVSPSDTIMSPCTAKLSALRSKQVTKYVRPSNFIPNALKATTISTTQNNFERLTESVCSRAKPKSLFAQASSKKLNTDENLLGTRPAQLDNPLGARSVKTTERTLTSRLR